MYIVTNIAKIKKGEGHKLIHRFDKEGKIETMEGFLGLEVLSAKKLEDYDEVSIVTRWDSEASFLGWTKSEAFKESHKHEGGKPDYILANKITYQEVEVIRNPIVSAS